MSHDEDESPKVWWPPEYALLGNPPADGWPSGSVAGPPAADAGSRDGGEGWPPRLELAHFLRTETEGRPLTRPPRVWWSPSRGGLFLADPDVDLSECRVPPDARQYALMPDPDPDLIRWCEYPDCLNSFHAVRGPRETGWVYLRNRGVGGSLLLCPTHRADPHVIRSRDFTLGDDRVTVVCDCGESASVWPTTGAAMRQWWEAHVRTVDRP